ncbi:MAG: S41 family peptidase [Lactobacillus sp.]|nr:S41 family peptidase [Lactobacillus sp.]
MKHSFSWKTLILVIIGSLLCGSALTFIFVAWMLGKSPLMNSDLRQIQEVYENIDQNYYKKVPSKKLVNGAISGMIDSLDDPYSQFLTAKNRTDLNESISGKISGIGATITKASSGIKIVNVMPHSPAKRAGLRADDVILKINQKSTRDLTVEQASALTRGKTGTKVQLQLQRQQKQFTVNLHRAPIKMATVTGQVNKDYPQIGQITIAQFSENTSQDLKKEIVALRHQGVKKLIIDVRSNPGGLMEQAVASASMFLKNGQKIVTITGRHQTDVTYRANEHYLKNYKVHLPVVVLIDNQSASAAEIFAAALHESGKTPLVGERSYGKGVVQTVNSLNSSSEMKITTAKWLTPQGHWINKKGLEPTFKVTYPAYLNLKAFTSKKTLNSGSSEPDVLTAQKVLQALGSDVELSGQLDTATMTALQNFQSQNELSATGTLNQATRQALTQKLLKQAQTNDEMNNKAIELLAKDKE